MNNLLSYCGLVDARISASEKDLPVLRPSCWHILCDYNHYRYKKLNIIPYLFLILTNITSITTKKPVVTFTISLKINLILLQKARVLDKNLTRHQDTCTFIFPYIF